MAIYKRRPNSEYAAYRANELRSYQLHEAKVVRLGDWTDDEPPQYRPVCTCGWRGEFNARRDKAGRDAAVHYRTEHAAPEAAPEPALAAGRDGGSDGK